MHEGWKEALAELGEEVDEYNLDARLQFFDSALMAAGERDSEGRGPVRKAMSTEQAIRLAAEGILAAESRWWPDVILCVSAFFTPPWVLEILRSHRHKIVMLFSESPYQDEMQLNMAQYADLSLVNDPLNIDKYRAIGRTEYMPHAWRPSVHYPPAPGTRPRWDLAFVGTGFPSRARFFSEMNLDGLDVKFAGPWMGLPENSPLRDWTQTKHLDGCIDNTETAEIYRQSRCGINFYRREAEDAHVGEGWSCGPREIEMAAAQLFFLRDPRPESDELFGMLPSFTSPGEASELLHWWLGKDGYRWEAARKARAAIEDRTFTNHAKKLLEMLDRQPVRM